MRRTGLALAAALLVLQGCGRDDSRPVTLFEWEDYVQEPFLKAYEASGWKIPISGRLDIGAATAAVSPAFLQAGGLNGLTSIAVFTPAIGKPAVRKFVQSYEAHYGLVPTQRSFFVYEAVLLVTDAIRHAGKDTPDAIEAALKATKMPSALGGSYKMNDHNHPAMPLFVTGLKDGKPAIIAQE